MAKSKLNKVLSGPGLAKVRTGIQGLDEITGGGLPKGRPTLVCGSAGCGKTLLAMEFLVRGVQEYNEPGVFVCFEENADELAKNVASLGFNIQDMVTKKKLFIDYVYIERSEIEETGEYDLEGLFVRLDHAIRTTGAKRVVLDTIEALFSGLPNPNILRAELRRLFRWLKEKGVTAIITAERGEGTLTRHGLEEYVADCVIMLDHRITEQISTRRMRIVKYRGSLHGTNEYPFLIDEQGIVVMPVTSVSLAHPASTERLSSGIPRLDIMLGGKGFYRGSSVLVSGTAGTGKTSIAMHLANAACKRGESCLYLAAEESMNQIIRNGRSIGINLEPWVKKGLLYFHSTRPTFYGLEMHLVSIHKLVLEQKPKFVIFDPVSNLTAIGSNAEVQNMLMRLLDFLKARGITSLCTSLTHGSSPIEMTEVGISSIMDSWLLLRESEYNGERTRVMYILKSRGMAHSNQVREFVISNKGIDLTDVYVGAGMVYTGAARLMQESKDEAETFARSQETGRLKMELDRNRKIMDAKISELRAEYDSKEQELKSAILQQEIKDKILAADRGILAKKRKADA
ncbi:MAG TPA: circadian clock protein KaiC [Nitrospirota bacterium]|nr:circadian clock protein KaiC [Nitrospirota bacterium]